jgi:hypothetical protein
VKFRNRQIDRCSCSLLARACSNVIAVRNIVADTALPAELNGSMAMRMSTAYFAGAGTVVLAVVIGLGGGLLIAEMMHPTTPAIESTKIARRSEPQPAPNPAASTAVASPAPVTSAATSSYLQATQAAATTAVVVAPAAPRQPNPEPAVESSPQPTPTAANSAPSQSAPSKSAPAEASAAPQRQADAPEAAFAKASDRDLKPADAKAPDTDSRRADRERRRAERHQRWGERRPHRRDEPDLRDVEQAVREDSAPRAYVVERVAPAAPRFNLFDDND